MSVLNGEFDLTHVMKIVPWLESAGNYILYIDKKGNRVVVAIGADKVYWVRCKYRSKDLQPYGHLEIRVLGGYSGGKINIFSGILTEQVFLVIFDAAVKIQKRGCPTERVGAGYLVVRSDLSIECKTADKLHEAIYLHMVASVFLYESQFQILIVNLLPEDDECAEFRLSKPHVATLVTTIKLGDLQIPIQRISDIIWLNYCTVALLGMSYPEEVTGTGLWRVKLAINHIALTVENGILSLTLLDGDNRFGYIDFLVSEVAISIVNTSLVKEDYILAVNCMWNVGDETNTEFYAFPHRIRDGRLLHIQDNPRHGMSRRSVHSLSGDDVDTSSMFRERTISTSLFIYRMEPAQSRSRATWI